MDGYSIGTISSAALSLRSIPIGENSISCFPLRKQLEERPAEKTFRANKVKTSGKYSVCWESWAALLKGAVPLFCLMLFLARVQAESGEMKAERDWKRFLSSTRYKQGMRRAEVEKRLASKIFAEFDADWGFALLRTVYYRLDDEWLALATYCSPGQPNSTPDAIPATMEMVAAPTLVRDTPEMRDRIEKQKEGSRRRAILDGLGK